MDRIGAALSGDTTVTGTKNMNGGEALLGTGAGTMDTVAAEYAQFGNYQEMMGYASSTNREEFSKKLLDKVGPLKGESAAALAPLQDFIKERYKRDMTHQDVLDALRGSGGPIDAKFVQMYTARHRELSARAGNGQEQDVS